MKRLLNTLCLCCAGLLALPAAAQSGYPAKPVEIVVGFPPGGGNDVLTRIVADKLQAALRQPFVVVNRPGADGIIAFDTVKRAAPDGYTLLVGPSSGMTVNPAVYAKLPYDPLADFEPITMVGGFPLFVVVPPDSPLRTLDDLVARAKQKPGDLAYASAATSFRVATEMFAQRAGVSLFHVPYQGSGKAVQAVMGKEVALSFADAAAATGQIKGGRLRALAVSTAQRVPGLAEVPTIAEAGYPGFEVVLWSGLFAPRGTPPEVVRRLQAEVAKIVRQPDVAARLEGMGVVPIGGSAEELRGAMSSQIVQYREVARRAGIKME